MWTPLINRVDMGDDHIKEVEKKKQTLIFYNII